LTSPPPGRGARSLAACALFLFSGAAGLVYEVLWSRQFAHHLGGSYPAIVAVVTAFLGGLAAGAAWGGRIAPRLRRPLRTYAILEAGIGIYGLLFPLLLSAANPLLGWCYRTLGDIPAAHTAARFLVAAALLLPPTVAMGATLPILVRFVVAGGEGVLGGTGLLYGLNTVGAAGGAMAAGFWLLPSLGLAGTLLAAVGDNAAVAAVAFLVDRVAGMDLPVEEPEPEAPPGAASCAATESSASAASCAAAEEATAVQALPATTDPAEDPPATASQRRMLLLVAAGSGAAAMLYQLAWTRALILSFGSSVHAFTLVLASFILGLGAGGLLAPLVRARGARLLLALATLEAGIGIAAWIGLHRLAVLPLSVILETPGLRGDYDALLRWQGLQALRVVILPTLGMGAAFPVLVAALAADGTKAPGWVGRVYGWNTAGTILGSLGGGLLLVPAVGLRGAILAGAAINLGLAALVASAALPWRRGIPVAAAVLAGTGALVLAAPPVPPDLLNCGPYVYGPAYLQAAAREGRDLARVVRDYEWDLAWFREGRSATVGVVRRPEGGAYLRINGKTDAGTGDLSTQVLLGQLPMMARPGARSALVVGLATGISAAAVASHGVERLDVVDISPEVVEASRFFDDLNGGVARRPGVRVIVEDGRTHVEHSRETYDVIVTEPTNPWIAGVSNLFTVEYFRACRGRLSPDGVLCVWLNASGISLDDIRLVLRTLRSVFPGTTVWESSPYVDYVLLAPRDDAADLVERIAGRPFPGGEAARSLALGGIGSREALLATLALDRRAAAGFAGEGELHTDDRLQLEFRAPRGAFGDAGYRTVRATDLDPVLDPSPALAFAGPDPAPLRAALAARAMAREGTGFFRRTGDPLFRDRFRARLARDPRLLRDLAPLLPPAPRGRALALSDALGPAGLDDDLLTHLLWAQAIDLLDGALRECRDYRWPARTLAECLQARARDSIRSGDLEGALADLSRARGLHPEDPSIPRWMAKVHDQAAGGDAASPHLPLALRLFDEAIRLHPRYEMARVERAVVLATLRRDAEAEAGFRAVLEMRPDSVLAMADYAQLLLYLGRRDEARALVKGGLGFEPGSRPLLTLRDTMAR